MECCTKHKHTPRAQEDKDRLIKRLNRAQGQVAGIKAMIEDDRYCYDVLVQLSAVQKALARVGKEILSEHLKSCVADDIAQGKTDSIDEMLDLVERFM